MQLLVYLWLIDFILRNEGKDSLDGMKDQFLTLDADRFSLSSTRDYLHRVECEPVLTASSGPGQKGLFAIP